MKIDMTNYNTAYDEPYNEPYVRPGQSPNSDLSKSHDPTTPLDLGTETGTGTDSGTPTPTTTPAPTPTNQQVTHHEKSVVEKDNPYKWDEIVDPTSNVSRQNERRAYYTALLETGNLGSAFKAMYAVEEDLEGQWNRNKKRDYYTQEGYTSESVQQYIKTGDTKTLAKQEKRDTAFTNLPNGGSALIDMLTGEIITEYTAPREDVETQIVPLSNGKSILINSKTGEEMKSYGTAEVKEPVTKTVDNVLYQWNGESWEPQTKKSPSTAEVKATREAKTLYQTSLQDLEALNTMSDSSYNILSNVDNYKFVGPIAGGVPEFAADSSASQMAKTLSGMTIDQYAGMKGASGMTGPLEKILMKSTPTRTSADSVVAKQAYDIKTEEIKIASNLKQNLINGGATADEIYRADQIIRNLENQQLHYNKMYNSFQEVEGRGFFSGYFNEEKEAPAVRGTVSEAQERLLNKY